ncbi:MAG: hypothetical protein EVG15_00290 [Candidatus Acididesulfobacter diazotrophicus]|uniref:Uncharacterized protein n=1 Tax=Candidatus Acididesulfobacter diazotrophicus TaxID=2597226 RepID=A0A519BQ03_9DELT|nr:MAG: hypothetical protein EVG15_00290 [Candidatus Acididesulfobacter diazotrophicus]
MKNILNNIVFIILHIIGFIFAVDLIFRIAHGQIGFGFQWLGLIVVILYGLWVKYILREKYFNRIEFFKTRLSAPYSLGAVLVLFIAMIIDLAGNERLANGFAIIVFYLLIATVAVEGIDSFKQKFIHKS